MKTLERILFACVLVLALPLVAAAEDASKLSAYKRDKNPSEVEGLIGQRFPIGAIPGWKRLAGSLLEISPQPGQEMGVEEMVRNGMFIFVIDVSYQKDMSRTILDAQILPRQAQFDNNGNFIKSKGWERLFRFSGSCIRQGEEIQNQEKIVGLVRTMLGDEKYEEPSFSPDVQRAWKIDKKTGRITAISPEGISCID